MLLIILELLQYTMYTVNCVVDFVVVWFFQFFITENEL